jgi:hypothetical protein
MLERKGNNLALEFDASGAHDGLVGCKSVYLIAGSKYMSHYF